MQQDLKQNWKLFTEYNDLGFDPLRWLPECSNELKHDRLNKISEELKRSNLKITPNYYSYFHYPEKKDAEIIRRIYRMDENNIKQEDLKTKKSISIFKCAKNIAYDTELMANEIRKVSDSFDSKIEVDKISIIPTNSKPEFQFVLFDHIKTHRGNKSGFTVVTNSNTQATDVTLPIHSPIHMEISFTESINLLNLLGCTKDIKLFPIYDAPTDQMLDEIRKNIDTYTIKYNFTFEDYSSLKFGGLYFGTTAVGNTHKELPNKYDMVEQDTQIILTDKLGLLTCLSLYIITNIDEKILEKMYKSEGIEKNKLIGLKQLATENLTEPKTSIGRIISKYLPDFDNPFEIESHILVTHPVSKNGIYSSLYELSNLVNKELIIEDIPFIDNNISSFISREHLVSNTTASTSNTNIILASKEISAPIIEALTKNKLNPTIIGRVGTSEKHGVRYNKKDKIRL